MTTTSTQLELLHVKQLPRCRLCHARGINKACFRCMTSRRNAFRAVPNLPDAEPSDLDLARAAATARRTHLAELGRPARVALIGCGKAKRDVPSPAHELYTGNLFRAAYRYARSVFRADEVYILSARHGVIEDSTIVHPYDESLRACSKREREAWRDLCLSHLSSRFGAIPVDCCFLAGQSYELSWNRLPGWTVTAPMRALPGIGRRVAALSGLHV